MRKYLFIFGVLGSVILLALSCQKAEQPKEEKAGALLPACGTGLELREGDIVFQTSMSPQSKAIELATHSEFSHVGIITIREGTPYVYEAVDKVRLTPVGEWISGGEQGKFAVKRLSRYEALPRGMRKSMRKAAKRFNDRSYDPYFRWDDEKLYCSELVYKIYRGGNVELGKLEKLRDMDLSHPSVKEMLRERFGDNIPYDETIITPVSIYNDEGLTGVCSNY